jgi:pyruvate,water dikinase
VPVGQPASADDFGPRDLVVMEGALEDLGLVAGLVTSLPQNVHSHVNLRMREKKIPNARVSDIFADGVLAQLDGKLARLQVTDTTARIDPATVADAEAFWATRHAALPPLEADLTEARVQGFPSLAAVQSDAYGRKAANLGELYGVLPPANRVAGFGIPFSTYRDWMHATGLDAQVTALLTDARTKTDAAFRRTRLAALRAAIEAAPVSSTLIDGLATAARQAFGDGYATTPLRFRSSSNVEDGDQVSGAGLYDSSRACFADDLDGDAAGPSGCVSAAERADLEQKLAARQQEQAAHPDRVWLAGIIQDLVGDLGKERSAARALKKVYASLWNDRAFEERAYWGLDHAVSFMGVAVNPAFVLEGLDAVGVTNLDVGVGGALCRVVSQSGGNPVVRPPDPTVVAETMTFRLGEQGAPTDVHVLVPSSLSAAPLWSDGHLTELGHLLATVQDHFARVVYPNTAPLSLDLEIKLTADDRVVIKQARPYILEAP